MYFFNSIKSSNKWWFSGYLLVLFRKYNKGQDKGQTSIWFD